MQLQAMQITRMHYRYMSQRESSAAMAVLWLSRLRLKAEGKGMQLSRCRDTDNP